MHLDTAACSGCGACVAACPQSALTRPDAAPVIAARRANDVAVALCARHSAATGRRAAPCVHALSLANLAALLAEGIGRMALATGDCNCCDMRPLVTLDDPLTRLKALCDSRGLLALRVEPATDADLALLPPADDLADRGRRALFGSTQQATPGRDPAPILAALQRVGAGGARVYAVSPVIDPGTCTGCDACLNICPTDALTLAPDAAYRIDPARCTGCRLCVDVCEPAAITLGPLAPAAPDLPLSDWRCRACGAPSHAPGPVPADGLCRICRETGHHKKLFQVLS